jgi:hypothetical protein
LGVTWVSKHDQWPDLLPKWVPDDVPIIIFLTHDHSLIKCFNMTMLSSFDIMWFGTCHIWKVTWKLPPRWKFSCDLHVTWPDLSYVITVRSDEVTWYCGQSWLPAACEIMSQMLHPSRWTESLTSYGHKPAEEDITSSQTVILYSVV